MKRYTSMPRRTPAPRRAHDWCEDDAPLLPQITVEEAGMINTGLVHARGDRIWRLPEPIGFIDFERFREDTSRAR